MVSFPIIIAAQLVTLIAGHGDTLNQYVNVIIKPGERVCFEEPIYVTNQRVGAASSFTLHFFSREIVNFLGFSYFLLQIFP